jgi:hypothetical protein
VRSQLKVAKIRLLALPCLSVRPSIYPHVTTIYLQKKFSVLLEFVDTFQFWLWSDNSNGHFACVSECGSDCVGNPQATLVAVVTFVAMVAWGIPKMTNPVQPFNHVGNPS